MKPNGRNAVLLALVLFASGILTGVLGHRYYQASVVSAKSMAETVRQQYMSEMQDRLKLSPAQVNQVQDVLDQTRAKMRSLHDRFRPEMTQIKQEQMEQITRILTPAQVAPYRKLVAERDDRQKQMEERDRQEAQHRSHSAVPAAP